MTQQLDTFLRESPSQTAGPYVHIGCTPNFAGIDIYGGDLGSAMKTGPVQGTEIKIRGAVFDGMGTPLRDAMIEIWQP
ncbi:MAG: protocatechuate 3,4-dioxygenase subunit alpha, partial [Litoreibacter sp.]